MNFCDVDEKGVQYMLLCRVIPSFPKESNGLKPKYYFVPSVDADTCIYPEYVVSFKLSPAVRGKRNHSCDLIEYIGNFL